jgi:hypothetical protein
MTLIAKKTAQWELRVMLATLLNGTIQFTKNGASSVVPVFETIPKGMPLPYVCLGDCTATNEETKQAFIDDYIIEIYVFTDYGGTMDNLSILNVVYQVLSTAYNTGELNFSPPCDFNIGMFWFGAEETRLLAEEGLAKRVKEELEQSKIELQFRIEQVR